MKSTSLQASHTALGARMVDFAGWFMPIQYGGILEEHNAVRTQAGVFDISHMGEFFVKGAGAQDALNALLTNNVSKLSPGECQYTLMLNEAGGVIDDLIIYCLAAEEYLLVVNASKIDEDREWIESHLPKELSFKDASDSYCGLAVQGPETAAVFGKLFSEELPGRNHLTSIEFKGAHGYVARTGYTGEDGYELFFPNEVACVLWDAVVAAGAKPCGLGARDTLRLEMCYPLNGNDLSPDHTPLEAGLGFFVDLAKGNFIGKSVLDGQKQNGLTRRLSAIRVEEKSPPLRPHYPVLVDGRSVSETTSGALSPSLHYGIAMAYLPIEYSKPGQAVAVEVRGKSYRAVVCKKPFYNPNPTSKN
ncbi:MAG: glycine cleavage system aminomethyltransferase GcvT [Chthoniobacterales bacterium]